MKRLADELLGNVGSVGIGRVDEGHSQLWQSSQRAERLLPVGRLAPYALAGDPHRAEAEAVDLDIAADPEGASGGRIDGGHGQSLLLPVRRGRSRARPASGLDPGLRGAGRLTDENWRWERSEEHTSELQSLMRIS